MSKCENCIHYTVCFLHRATDEQRCDFQNCIYYQDKSLYVKLPCEVGDTVYIPSFFDKIVKEYKVISIDFNKFGKWFSLDIDSPYISRFPFEAIGRTVFLIKEEAEKKLKKLYKEKIKNV